MVERGQRLEPLQQAHDAIAALNRRGQVAVTTAHVGTQENAASSSLASRTKFLMSSCCDSQCVASQRVAVLLKSNLSSFLESQKRIPSRPRVGVRTWQLQVQELLRSFGEAVGELGDLLEAALLMATAEPLPLLLAVVALLLFPLELQLERLAR